MKLLYIIAKKIVSQFTTYTLLLIVLFSAVNPVMVQAQDAVGGFTGCDFSDVKANPKDGPKLFENCLKQVITFLFVAGLFLIVFRIGVAAFTGMNPTADGDAIKSSITVVRDISIGVFLIIGPSIILTTINPATNNLGFLDLGNLPAIITPGGGSNNAPNTTNTNNNTPTPTATNTTPASSSNNPTPTTTNTNPANPDGSNQSTLPAAINSPADLNQTLTYYLENPTNPAALSTLQTYLTKEQDCKPIFIPASDPNGCKKLYQDGYISVLTKIKAADVKVANKELLKDYKGNLLVSSQVSVNFSYVDDFDSSVVAQIKYTQNPNSDGIQPAEITNTLKVTGCTPTLSATIPAWSSITNQTTCNIQIID